MTARTVLPAPPDGTPSDQTGPGAGGSPAAGEAAGAGSDPSGGSSGGSTLRGRVRARWRRGRWVVAVAAVVLLAAAIAVLTMPRGGGGELDPENPAPEGARAAAQILRNQGVEVTKVSRSGDAARSATAGSTLVVIDMSQLGPAQLDRLAATQADLVLVEPDAVVLQRLAPTVSPAGIVPADVRSPNCPDPAAEVARDALAGGHLYRADGAARVCYPAESGDGDRSGSYVVVEDGARSVTIIGQGGVLTNDRLATDGNAALALRTLGAHPRLVWYVPDPLELGATTEQPDLLDLVPSWVRWAVAQLGIAVAVVLIWRARRLGALVSEPLPVVVRAAETEEGRARLYRQAAARGRAAATLRTAALRRLASRLAMPAGTTPEQVARLVAAATGRPDAAVHAILLGPAPERDTALVALADDIDTLEREIATRTQPGRNPLP